MNCMLDELEECLADSNAKYEGELSDIGRCLSDFLNGLETEKSAFRETLLVWHDD